MKKNISLTAAAAITAALLPAYSASAASGPVSVEYKYGDTAYTRSMEQLDRGLIAVNTGSGIYLGWRLLGTEGKVSSINAAPGFDIYKNGSKLTTVKDSTNYIDKSGKSTDSYSVAIAGSSDKCDAVKPMSNNYFDIPMDKPDDFVIDSETSYSYSVGDCSTGDLDGDGEYEIVVKWDANSKDNSQSGISGNVIFDAYKLDGTKLWRIDLGRNVRAGAHYSQFLVYDFDMDGKAEMTVQTAPGSMDSSGSYVTAVSADSNIRNTDNTAEYINSSGYNLTSDEFLTVFNGETGKAVDTIYYPNQRIAAYVWGDTYGNRCDRFTAAVANMDGERPYAVYMRGYYMRQSGGSSERQAACAVSFDGSRLNCKYSFDTYNANAYSAKSSSVSYNGNTYKGVDGYVSGNEIYVGNGNHNCTVADVDNDGKDEVITGALCYEITDDDRLGVRWCTFMEHGDALHIGDYDPTHDGFEFFTVHEDSGPNTKSGESVEIGFGMSVIDANDGSIIFHEAASADTGRGVMANIGMGGYYQIWSAKNSNLYMANGGTSFTAGSKSGLSQNFRVFWDADINEELLDGTGITSWNGSGMSKIFTASECTSINGTKAVPALQADLFGDWREEVCYPLTDNSAIRVFTTTTATTYKLPTLMHDPVYRSGVAAEQTSYNQPPHIGFYLSDEIYRAELIGIEVTAPYRTEYKIGEELDLTGMTVKGEYSDETSYDITGYSVTGFDNLAAGEQTITVSYANLSKSFNVNVMTELSCDQNGMITGYTGSDTSVIIPESINGIEIKGISEGAFDNSSVNELYVYDNVERIENNSFENITVYGYEGSDMHIYALENNVDFVVIERGAKDYIMDVTFDEEEYSGLSMFQTGQSQTVQIGNAVYGVGGRTQRGVAAGDGASGFSCSENDGEYYLYCGIGQFTSNNRHGYMSFADSPVISSEYDNVLAFDFMIPYTPSRKSPSTNCLGYASIQDNSGEVDRLSLTELGIEYDTWYGYTLIYHKNSYYRAITDANGELLSLTKLSGTESDTGISKINFLQESGDFGQGGSTYIAIDNLKMYTASSALSNVYIVVRDEDNYDVENASVAIGGVSGLTDTEGTAEFFIPSGIYSAVVTADSYDSKTAAIAAYKNDVVKNVTLSHTIVPAEGVTVMPAASIAVYDTADLEASAIPENATDRDFVWSSDDESIASVDQSGRVTGVSEGSTLIRVTLGGYEAVCEVNVYNTIKYLQVPSRVEIEGGADEAYIPLSGTNTVSYSAKVYDQNNVIIKDADVVWECSAANIADGLFRITPDTSEGVAKVTASCKDAAAETEINLVSLMNGGDIFAATSYDEAAELNLHQGTSNVENTYGDLTYGSGARSSGGRYGIGVWASTDDGNTYIVGGSDSWSSANRGSYINLNNAPEAYDSTKQYVFETDVCFAEANQSPVTLSNGALITLASTDMPAGVWFRYMLVYAGGVYTQYIFDADGELVSYKTVSGVSDTPISSIRFGMNGETGSTYLDNTYYYAKQSVISDLTVKVFDGDGAEMPDVPVTIGSIESVTNLRGRTTFTLPQGVYKVDAVSNGTYSESVVLDGENKTISVICAPAPAAEPKLELSAWKNGSGSVKAELTRGVNGVIIAAAYGSDGELTAISAIDAAMDMTEYDIVLSAEGAVTVMLWDSLSGQTALTKAAAAQ